MLKHRIIPVLLTDGNGQCVKPVAFERPYRKLGTMEQYIRVIESRNVDELIIIDINATHERRKPDFKKLRSWCDNLFCPVTYGGGISTLDDIRMALENGADKVAIKNIHLTEPSFMDKAVEKFGAQAIVMVLDCDMRNYIDDYPYQIFDRGAGEILLTDILKDGTMEGYNLELIYEVSSKISSPVVALGGCGEIIHMSEALKAGASAVAAGSLFLYTDITPKQCAIELQDMGHLVRI